MDKQDKPLSDWTLGEARELCAGRSYCKGCPMAGAVCSIEKVVCPQEWDLTDKPRFTEEEMAAARMFLSAYPQSTIERGGPDCLILQESPEKPWEEIPPKLFPSLRPGQSVRLEDVWGANS